jgi:hypothetical protein
MRSGYFMGYLVFENGDIYKKCGKGKIKLSIVRGGYYGCGFHQNNKVLGTYLHRVLALLFIPNPFNKTQVNHKNGIKTDNRLDNLEWCTCKENITHAYKLGLQVRAKGIESKQNIPIVQLDLNDNIIREFIGVTEASQITGLNKGHISSVTNHKRETAGGYKWKKKQELIIR